MACSHFRAIVLSSDVRNDSRKAMWATLTLPVLISIPEVWGRAMALPLLASWKNVAQLLPLDSVLDFEMMDT